MIVFFLLLILLTALVVLINLFNPKILPWYRPSLILGKSEISPIIEPKPKRRPIVLEGLHEPDENFRLSLEENISRLEMILGEKNIMIEKLQRELTAEKSHRLEFEKVKELLDDEILTLRRKFKNLKEK